MFSLQIALLYLYMYVYATTIFEYFLLHFIVLNDRVIKQFHDIKQYSLPAPKLVINFLQ